MDTRPSMFTLASKLVVESKERVDIIATARTWNYQSADGARVLTCEPDNFDEQQLAQLLADADPEALPMTATTASGVWESDTTLITFRAAAIEESVLPLRREAEAAEVVRH